MRRRSRVSTHGGLCGYGVSPTAFRLDRLHYGWTCAARRWLLTRYRQAFGRVDHRTIRRYFLDHDVRKLHLGCGHNVIDGWLNTDVMSLRRDVPYLNAIKRFPFDDGEFDCVFSEHLIEHFPFAHGLAMLKECHRILKPGGRIRITTPDLTFLIQLCCAQKSDVVREYIEWVVAKFSPSPPPGAGEALVVNDFMRNWGHQFIYDEETMRLSLRNAGFSDVVRRELNASDDEALRDLENESRMPAGFLALESMTLEASKG